MTTPRFLWIGTILAALVAVGTVAGCGDREASKAPKPAALTREDVGYYCRMTVLDHKGPKGQVYIKGQAKPLWFTSVRDTIAFTLRPGEPKGITAIYVNDMARANWDHPEPGTWIAARAAVYVIGSSRRGGMGGTEAVPFGDRTAAERFAKKFGGRVVTYDKIPASYVLGPTGDEPMSMPKPNKGRDNDSGEK